GETDDNDAVLDKIAKHAEVLDFDWVEDKDDWDGESDSQFGDDEDGDRDELNSINDAPSTDKNEGKTAIDSVTGEFTKKSTKRRTKRGVHVCLNKSSELISKPIWLIHGR
ncbi:MAG: hypothetical protein M1821_009725, partial [Bathelium mastoideum]